MKKYIPFFCTPFILFLATCTHKQNTVHVVQTNTGDEKPHEIKIGNDVWSSENLAVKHFANGDPITEAKSSYEWMQAGLQKKPVWSYFNFDSTTLSDKGIFYNWYAVSDVRGLAPSGWHIPNNTEWKNLIDHLGGENVAGNKLTKKNGWKLPNTLVENSGFNALPHGSCTSLGQFIGDQESAVFWSSDSVDYAETQAWVHRLLQLKSVTNNDTVYSVQYYQTAYFKVDGFSVRCVRD